MTKEFDLVVDDRLLQPFGRVGDAQTNVAWPHLRVLREAGVEVRMNLLVGVPFGLRRVCGRFGGGGVALRRLHEQRRHAGIPRGPL